VDFLGAGQQYLLALTNIFHQFPLRIGNVKASRPLIHVLVINDNHYGLTFLFEL
jgi:hypothetical protein